MFDNILVVCVGNICRSPMAKGLLDAKLGRANCCVSSAGIHALVGRKPDAKACQILLEEGVDISEEIAQQLTKDMVRKADLILTMESAQTEMIIAVEPSAKGKVFILGYWSGFEVPDPYQRDLDVFQNTLQLIKKGVNQWIEKI